MKTQRPSANSVPQYTDQDALLQRLDKFFSEPIDPQKWEEARKKHEEDLLRLAPKTVQTFLPND